MNFHGFPRGQRANGTWAKGKEKGEAERLRKEEGVVSHSRKENITKTSPCQEEGENRARLHRGKQVPLEAGPPEDQVQLGQGEEGRQLPGKEKETRTFTCTAIG